jgi:hypothetical protein
MFDSIIKSSVKNLEPMNPRAPKPFPVAILFFLFTLIFVLLPRLASAQGLLQGISGSLEFNYSYLTSKTTDASGNTIKTNTQTYNPRFQLDINTTIFPNLRLRAGGVAEGIISDLKIDGEDTTTKLMNFRPYIDLTLDTPLYTASLGYVRRQQKTEVTHSPSTTLINDEVYAMLGWRPEGLPSMDLQIRRRNSYDEDKSFLDIEEDFVSLNSRYQYKGLLLNYYGTYLQSKDDIIDLAVVQYTHAGRASYSNLFFDKRVSVSTNYNILYQETKTESEGNGLVSSQVFPAAGLSLVPDPPPSTLGALLPNPSLIDGNLTASSAINIGLPPLGGETRPRSIGLDFLNPTAVNQLLVWVDTDLSTASGILSFFFSNINIYRSNDNLNWFPVPVTSPITFGPFQNRFQINFTEVITRYIKVVISPLTSAVLGAAGFPNIFVTEMQAFLNTPAADIKRTFSATTHNYDLDVKTMILDNPSLFYEVYGYFNRRDPSGQQTYTVINAFHTYHRLSEVFSGRARVAREDGKETDRKRFAYVYDAALTADPLRTLHNSLVLSGREEEIEGKPNNTNSLFLYNTAQLYKGIDVNLNGGVNFTKEESGEKGRNFIINFQTNIIPHRTLALGLNYNNTISRRTGGDQGSSSTYNQEVDINLSFNPVRTLNFFAFIQVIDQKGQKVQTNQNYAINWSPFPDGALQFNIAYNENLRTEDHLKERTFFPSIRYNLSKRSYLQVSYQLIRSRSDIQKIDSNLISTTLKLFF